MSELETITYYFSRHFFRLLLGVMAIISVDFCQLWIPRLIKKAIDELAGPAPAQAVLLRCGLIIFGLALVIALLRFIWRRLILGFSRLLEMELRNKLFSHILTLDRAFFQQKSTGEIMALATNDLQAVQMACGMGIVAAIDASVMGMAALACMFYIHPLLAATALLPMPFLIVGARVLTRRMHRLFTTVQEEFSQLTEFTRNTLANIRLVKAYNQEHHHSRQFARLGRSYVHHNFRLSFVNGSLFPLSGLVANTGMLLILLVGGRLVISQKISIGDFVAFTAYLYMLTWPMMAMGWVVNLFQRGKSSLARINNILNVSPILKLPVNGIVPRQLNEIKVKNLSFTYPVSQNPVLKNLNLDITPGVWGITGKTGCGKSALCQVLAHLYPLGKNMLYWNGQDINELDTPAVRKQITYVEQDGSLFSDTIRANIALGKPEADDHEIEAAAKLADIHHEVKAMKQGYDTMIGEKGVLLSGGQRQRILLARSLLPGRPLLIIDDALSAVDSATEQRIIANLRSYHLFNICIIVSHRVVSLSLADKIIIIDHGVIVAVGSHAELQNDNEFYATICRRQKLL